MAENIFEFQKLKEFISSSGDETLKSILESKKYSASKTNEWIDKIGTNLISQLRDASPNFKYIVSTVIMQKTGAGLHSEVATCWDPSTDGATMIKYENDSLVCVCTVIGIAI